LLVESPFILLSSFVKELYLILFSKVQASFFQVLFAAVTTALKLNQPINSLDFLLIAMFSLVGRVLLYHLSYFHFF
jgi:hypothetical protein